MKRVCTLRKVLRSLSKVLLEKLFYRSYISCGFLSPLSSYCSYMSWLFVATQFLLYMEYLQPGDFLCCKYKYFFRNLQVFEHFFFKKGYFSYVFYKIAPILGF